MINLAFPTFLVFKTEAQQAYSSIQSAADHHGILSINGVQYEVVADPKGTRGPKVRYFDGPAFSPRSKLDNSNDKSCLLVRNELVEPRLRVFSVTQASTIPHIAIRSDIDDENFVDSVNAALTSIDRGPSGHVLLSDFENSLRRGHKVTIIKEEIGHSSAKPTLPEGQSRLGGATGQKERDRQAIDKANKRLFGLVKGEGADAEVRWNPLESLTIDEDGYPSVHSDQTEAFVILAHELVHARRMVKGTYTGKAGEDRHDARTGAGKEELRTVGLGAFAQVSPSENSIRREHNLPLRRSYNAK